MKNLSDNVTSVVIDYLTCGRCLKEFPLQKITNFIQHKKLDCEDAEEEALGDPELQCNFCPQGFMTAWGLLVHAQFTHNLRIFLERASTLPQKRKSVSISDTAAQGDASDSAQNVEIKTSAVSQVSSFLSDNQVLPPIVAMTVPTVQTIVTPPVPQAREVTVEKPCQRETICGITANQFTSGSELDRNRNSGISVKNKQSEMVVQTSNMTTGKPATPSFRTVTKPVDNKQTATSQPLDLPVIAAVPATAGVSLSKSSMFGLTNLFVQRSHTNSTRQVTCEAKILEKGNFQGNVTDSELQNTPAGNANGSKNISSDSVMAEAAKVQSIQKSVNSSTVSRLPSAAGQQSILIRPNPNGVNLDNGLTTKDSTAEEKTQDRSEATDMKTDSISTPEVPESSDNADSEGGQLCCDSQKCGVTVIPGSHETLKKCCNAVVPKKRKRHMETKHMPFSWSSSKYARRKKLPVLGGEGRASSGLSISSKSSGGTIYIDVEPDPSLNQAPKGKNNQQDGTSTSSSITVTSQTLASDKPVSAQSRTKSVILKPGAIFSIPFTYTIPASGSTTAVPTTVLPAAVPILQAPTAGNQASILTQTIRQGNNNGSLLLSQNEDFQQNNEGEPSSGQPYNAEGLEDFHDTTDAGTMHAGNRRRKYPTSKPFKCEVCTLAFNQRIHLKKHMSKHTGIKPYKCQQCDYSTVERSHLKVHIRIHTGEKPFKCTYCEYATAQNSTLKIHLKRHHGGRMFECGECDKKFTQQEMLSSHEVEHKMVDAETSPAKPLVTQREATPPKANQQSETSPLSKSEST